MFYKIVWPAGTREPLLIFFLFLDNTLVNPTSSDEFITLQNVPPSYYFERNHEDNAVLEKNEIPNIGEPATSSSQADDNRESSLNDYVMSEDESIGYNNTDDSDLDPDYGGENSSSSSTSSDEVPNEEAPLEVEEIRGRKRKAKPEKWNKSIRKACRNHGKKYTYVNSKKETKVVEDKAMGPPCKDSCTLNCKTKVTEDQRLTIFTNYWALGDLQRQRNFLLLSMESVEPRYRYVRENSHRQKNNAFYFSVNGQKIRVCKTFFKATLSISDRPIRTVLNKSNDKTIGMIDIEKRGKHGKQKKVDESIKEAVRCHIKSIPRMESHYCRKDSVREYIEGDKTLADLHRDYCEETEAPHANYLMYSRIFNMEFNIGFHRPKKDQCEDCIKYQNAPEEEKNTLKDKYDRHLVEKELSREEKKTDKNSENKNLIVAVYDLEAVLQCPRGEASGFYYVSKINVFNFTLYELKSKNPDVYCYVWDETQAKRGANEIGTCVLKYIESLKDRESVQNGEKLDVIFYSDNCCGQQKNRFMLSMYHYAVEKYSYINSITHKFLVKGHSQNEGDCVHSVIERTVKKFLKAGPICIPAQYITLIRGAKKTGRPYQVNEMSYDSFFDLKNLAEQSLIGTNLKDSNGEAIKITSVSMFRFEKESPQKIFFKTSYSEKEFCEIHLKERRSKTRSTINELKQLYTSKIGAEAKKTGLLKLLEKNVIPKSYAFFYENL